MYIHVHTVQHTCTHVMYIHVHAHVFVCMCVWLIVVCSNCKCSTLRMMAHTENCEGCCPVAIAQVVEH